MEDFDSSFVLVRGYCETLLLNSSCPHACHVSHRDPAREVHAGAPPVHTAPRGLPAVPRWLACQPRALLHELLAIGLRH
jgi:hypothetical protein